jgi:predicted metal-dependent phosphoesterase TrpH
VSVPAPTLRAVRIDLHTHSTASDGTDAPAELVAHARAAGLDVVALTDHDTTSGWSAAVQGLPAGLGFVRGTEISCQHDGVALHLLAYLFDPEHEGLRSQLRRTAEDRVTRAQAITARLEHAGYPLTWDGVRAQISPGAAVGRPHIADALVAAGVVRDRSSAFADLLHSSSPFYVRHYALDPVEAVRLVRAAGGVPVFAHPGASRRGRTVDESVIGTLAAAGLAALEVDHRDHDEAARTRLRGLAEDLGLLVTGSSDYHGAGKANRIGEHLTDPAMFGALVEQARGVPVVAA